MVNIIQVQLIWYTGSSPLLRRDCNCVGYVKKIKQQNKKSSTVETAEPLLFT
jgi:hypothetical protein